MSYISAINTMINPAFIYKGKTLTGEAECGSIEIRGKYVILQTDHKEFNEKVLKTIYIKGIATSICDYVIVSDDVILICELKSNNTTGKSIQQRNTGRMVKYLLQMVKEHDSITSPLPEIKYVCFAKKYSAKQKSKPDSKLDFVTLDCDGITHKSYHLPCNTIYSLGQFI